MKEYLCFIPLLCTQFMFAASEIVISQEQVAKNGIKIIPLNQAFNTKGVPFNALIDFDDKSSSTQSSSFETIVVNIYKREGESVNEGDLICSGQMVTPEIIKFMAEHAKGLICLAIAPEIAEKMNLPQMVDQNSESMKTAFTVSIDAHEKYGVTTGISAFDRAKTIEVCLAHVMQKCDYCNTFRRNNLLPIFSTLFFHKGKKSFVNVDMVQTKPSSKV